MTTSNATARIGVVGTGVIGASWAAYFLAKGSQHYPFGNGGRILDVGDQDTRRTRSAARRISADSNEADRAFGREGHQLCRRKGPRGMDAHWQRCSRRHGLGRGCAVGICPARSSATSGRALDQLRLRDFSGASSSMPDEILK
jgi:hypothetical protein